MCSFNKDLYSSTLLLEIDRNVRNTLSWTAILSGHYLTSTYWFILCLHFSFPQTQLISFKKKVANIWTCLVRTRVFYIIAVVWSSLTLTSCLAHSPHSVPHPRACALYEPLVVLLCWGLNPGMQTCEVNAIPMSYPAHMWLFYDHHSDCDPATNQMLHLFDLQNHPIVFVSNHWCLKNKLSTLSHKMFQIFNLPNHLSI